MSIPSRFNYLLKDPLPPIMVRVALGMYGTYEDLDAGQSNRYITAWADEIEQIVPSNYNMWAADYYNSDLIPWCGLFMAVCAARSCQARPERFPPVGYLAAMSWASWGKGVTKNINNVCVGDVIVINQPHTHVTMAVGTTSNGNILGLGGNQSNMVNIKEFEMSRVYSIRRPPYIIQPAGARHVVVSSTGDVSTNER